jgi:hypothetical protein
MFATLKKLAGGKERAPATIAQLPLDRDALVRPAIAARAKLDAATKEHADTTARVAETDTAIAEAQKAFDAAPDDKLADRLLELRRERERRALYSQRTQRAVAKAEGELRAAEKARDEAVLAWLDLRASTSAQRMRDLWETKGREQLEVFIEFTRELEAILADASDATREAARIRGLDTELLTAKTMGIASNRSVIRAAITDAFHPDDRLRVERLVSG